MGSMIGKLSEKLLFAGNEKASTCQATLFAAGGS